MVWARIRVDGRLAGGLQALLGAPMAAYSGCGQRDGGIGHGKRRSRTGTGASLRGRSVGGDVGSVAGWRSGWECQGAAELGFPWPALGQMQGEAACRAGEASG